jgi:hypothetical protein
VASSNMMDSSSYVEAIQFEEWAKPIGQEIKSLEKMETWIHIKLPLDMKAISTKWIFKTKRYCNGKILKKKIRMVV